MRLSVIVLVLRAVGKLDIHGILSVIQWGMLHGPNGSTTKGKISLPLSASIYAICLQHYGSTAQSNGFNDYDGTVTSTLSDAEAICYIAITH